MTTMVDVTIERKDDQQKFNNIKIDSRCLYCSMATAATAAVVVVFTLVVAVLRACAPVDRSTTEQQGHKILKQAKLGQFSTYWTETGRDVHKNFTYHMIRPFDCMILSVDYFKRDGFWLKILLSQAWFKVYSTSCFSCCTFLMGIRIGRTSPS